MSEWVIVGEVMRRETSDARGRDVRRETGLRVSCLASPVTSRLVSRVSRPAAAKGGVR